MLLTLTIGTSSSSMGIFISKRALEEEEALVEENLVEILARGRKDLRNKNFLIILIV